MLLEALSVSVAFQCRFSPLWKLVRKFTTKHPRGREAMKWRRVLIGLASAACAALAAGTMAVSPARADTAPTSTTLTLSTNSVFLGFEDLAQITVSVVGGDGDPSGSFGVRIGQTLLCSGELANGTGDCSLSPRQLAPGSYPLTAVYSGDENSGSSASNTETLTVVAGQPTTTTLTLSAPTVVSGKEGSEELAFRVSPVLTGTPTGTVTITAGTATLCGGAFNLTLETFSGGNCNLTASQLPVGSYQITATYAGDGTFTGSASAAQTLTVLAVQPTTTTLTLSAPSVPFGNEQTETLTASVTPAAGGIPTGNVTVVSGTTSVCTITLAGGTGQCTLTGSQLRPGSYPLTAAYGGDNTDTVSSDTSQTLTVAKEPTTTSLALSADTVAHGSEQAELFTVEVDPATSGTPTGNVTVKAGAVATCTIILASGTGNCFLTASQLKLGTYQITATYNGDTTYAVSASTPPQTLNVVAK
jgi:Bacterial Ig-like domain (group 3)